MQQTINPDKQTVESCLKNKNYYIDFYQREYVWSKETVEILLKDVLYAFELSYEQYKDAELSQEVLDKYNWYYLNVFITNNVNGKVYIVDGQQRLSTLTLIACKLYHATGDNNLKGTLKDCIYCSDKWQGNIYCLDNSKRKNVMECILEDKPMPTTFLNKTEETLVNRYKDISAYFDNLTMDSRKLNTFIMYFLERLVLVELSITKDDTPMVFEVINDRGEALKPFEILKGKLVGALDKMDTEAHSLKWDESMNSLFGIEDEFFADYLKSRFIFKRNSEKEALINNSYHRYIFESNDIAEALQFRKRDNHQVDNIKNFINYDLKYYSRLYKKIRKNEDENSQIHEFLLYCNGILGLSGHYQIIMAACAIDDSQEEEKIKAISREYERMFILLTLNGVYNSNDFQEISYSLNEKIREVSIADYRAVFDEAIKNAIKERKQLSYTPPILDYSTFLKADYTNIQTRTLRYLLARVEKYLCEGMNISMNNDVNYISTKTGNTTGYHIEHILSHNSTNQSYFASDEEFESQRNRLGGLLLLKGRDNISSSNEEYEDKLKTYSAGLVWGHTLCDDFYHVNKDFDSFNDDFCNKTGLRITSIAKFNKAALELRCKLMYEFVKIIWDL